MQSRKRSAIESAVSTFVGFYYAVPLNYYMVAQMQWDNYWHFAIVNTVLFTILSFTSRFILRRVFNLWDERDAPSLNRVTDHK